MKFGKVDPEKLDGIDFSIPDISHRSLQVLRPGASRPTAIRFGTTAWSVDEWRGSLYPETSKKSEYLAYYSTSFDTIELNATFYHIPKEETVRSWAKSVVDPFRFCPKIPRLISHHRALGAGTGTVSSFCRAVAHFGDKLGICFLQLPPGFSMENLNTLADFISGWPKDIPLAIEARHPSFFKESGLHDAYYDVLHTSETSVVVTDVSGFREALHFDLPTRRLLVRFVGNDLHATDEKRMNAWAARLFELSTLGLKETYFFMHQNDNLLAPKAVDQCISLLKKAGFDRQLKEIKWLNNDKQLLLF